MFMFAICCHPWAPVLCGFRNAESCQGLICGKSSAKRSANYLLSLFRIPQPKNYAFPQITKLPFARIVQQGPNLCRTFDELMSDIGPVLRLFVNRAPDVQPMHSSIRRSGFISFRILCGPFAKEQGSCFTILTNFKVSFAFQVSCHFASRCDWFQFI